MHPLSHIACPAPARHQVYGQAGSGATVLAALASPAQARYPLLMAQGGKVQLAKTTVASLISPDVDAPALYVSRAVRPRGRARHLHRSRRPCDDSRCLACLQTLPAQGPAGSGTLNRTQLTAAAALAAPAATAPACRRWRAWPGSARWRWLMTMTTPRLMVPDWYCPSPGARRRLATWRYRPRAAPPSRAPPRRLCCGCAQRVRATGGSWRQGGRLRLLLRLARLCASAPS